MKYYLVEFVKFYYLLSFVLLCAGIIAANRNKGEITIYNQPACLRKQSDIVNAFHVFKLGCYVGATSNVQWFYGEDK